MKRTSRLTRLTIGIAGALTIIVASVGVAAAPSIAPGVAPNAAPGVAPNAAAGVAPNAVASIAPAGAMSIKDRFRVAVGACASTLNADCRTEVVATLARRAMSERIESLPSGREGLGAWIRLASELHGLPLSDVTIPSTSLSNAVHSFYRESGARLSQATMRSVDQTIAALRPATAATVAQLVNALRVSNRLSAEATRGSGLEKIVDPARAMMIVSYALAPKGTVPEELRLEAVRNLAILERVDLSKLALAATVTADALAQFKGVDEDTSLPFIFVGGEGDTTHSEPLALLIDQSGNDTYTNNAGGGLFGIAGGSIAADLGDGTDRYVADAGAQGFAVGAAGLLYDEGGNDHYSLRQFGQGAGVAGVGVLYDAGVGDDVYDSPGEAPIATKAATLGGIGLLIDESGDDYMRQDMLDGFDYAAAGGFALLANLGNGNDTYRTDSGRAAVCVGETCIEFGNISGPVQVSAEVNATAILYEEGGNDSYQCGEIVRQGCQGAAGAGSFSLLWDRAGNDTYTMGTSDSTDFLMDLAPIQQPSFPMGQGGAYEIACVPCPPPSIAILYDEDGSDTYTAEKWAQGYGTFGAIGILYDTGSDADIHNIAAPLIGTRTDGTEWVDGLLGVGRDE